MIGLRLFKVSFNIRMRAVIFSRKAIAGADRMFFNYRSKAVIANIYPGSSDGERVKTHRAKIIYAYCAIACRASNFHDYSGYTCLTQT